jgi:DNA-binding transcriptional regulator YiaG
MRICLSFLCSCTGLPFLYICSAGQRRIVPHRMHFPANMSHLPQDWTEVVFHAFDASSKKKQPVPGAAAQPRSAGATMSSTTAKPAWKIEQAVDSDAVGRPLVYTSKQEAQRIVQARVALKLSQKDLAARLNLPARTVADIEAGRAVENRRTLAAIKRHLGL